MRVGIHASAVFLLSLSLFIFRLGIPSGYVYDEAAYVPSARGFLHHGAEGVPQHPPLAKLIMAGGIRLIGDRPAGWRFAAAVFGAVSAVTMFLWTYVFVRSIELALTATILTVFNNFLYVMSRVAMLDVFYFTFVLLGHFTVHRRGHRSQAFLYRFAGGW